MSLSNAGIPFCWTSYAYIIRKFYNLPRTYLDCCHISIAATAFHTLHWTGERIPWSSFIKFWGCAKFCCWYLYAFAVNKRIQRRKALARCSMFLLWATCTYVWSAQTALSSRLAMSQTSLNTSTISTCTFTIHCRIIKIFSNKWSPFSK